MDHKRNANILENIYIFRTLLRREAAIYPDSGGLGRLGIVFRLHIVDAEEFVLIEVSLVQFHGQFRICTANKKREVPVSAQLCFLAIFVDRFTYRAV